MPKQTFVPEVVNASIVSVSNRACDLAVPVRFSSRGLSSPRELMDARAVAVEAAVGGRDRFSPSFNPSIVLCIDSSDLYAVRSL